ncbi:WXG100 family type VII secretion target [Streptomyces sp. DW26H14]|uniref:WXG100 family type VII secretion target n=1 Tax=Streptomyces sp. DW26H14 TaxID=3435395 RepID=UPI00403E0D6B
MTTYQVSLEQMSFVEGEMQSITTSLGTSLGELEDGVKTKLAGWENSLAGEGYRLRQAKWQAAYQQMSATLAKAQAAIGTIGEYYNSGEKYGAGLWDQ